ncbi:MAG TPA: kelch repeat-containing protein [Thermoanaerobaculia bacterium]|jgi:hypothetical protein|nr:kelch repeat-containing protein [Thermoanaerobaculia bacterium]
MKRVFLFIALLLSAHALFAANPSARTGTRMVFDESSGFTILFGGETAVDTGTVQSYHPNETWIWTGDHWIQRFPANSPPGRSSPAMVYDSNRARIVLFGGRSGTSDLADTWVYDDRDWTQIQTGDVPSARSFPGAAYDRARDRVVLFGGGTTTTATNGTITITNLYDTWEFDGTNWTKVIDNGPTVIRPMLVYDEVRNQTLLVGEDDKLAPLMYVYDPAARTWTQITPAAMPPCANQAALTFQRSTGTVLLVGGVCVTSTSSSPVSEEIWSWDGSTWTKLETKSAITRVTNQALAYDAARNVTVEFGGTEAYGSPTSATHSFDPSLGDDTHAGDWVPHDTNANVPGPRSLAPLRADPVNKIVYLLNGLTDGSYFTDFWMYQNGGWQKITADNTPSCGTPFAAFDTDRSKLVAVCNDGTTSEWDGTAWKAFSDLKTKPSFRRFSAMVYDQSLKKTVLYGGYDDSNYVDNTWLWDGTQWSEQKKKAAPARGLTAMWFDPVLHKTVLFGGIGRPHPQDRLQRYVDMWSLDSNGWTEVKPSTLPTTRYGAQVAVDPRTGHAILFGGLRLDIDSKGLQKQVYANDMWEWDGSSWKQLTTNGSPTPRENASMAFDYGRNNFVLFGGWSGYYLSDLWLLDGDTWRVIPETLKRQRSVRH